MSISHLLLCSNLRRPFESRIRQSVAFRAVYLRMAVICFANTCLSLIIVFENKFSAIISQSQQSSIATALLRSPLNCCDRSNPGFVSRWRFVRFICVWLLFAVANLCLCQMIAFENKFSAIIRQSQQSSIATALLRSPLNCCDRSNPGFVSRWRFGRLICVWLLFAIANTCLSLIIVFENEFSAIISQSQQSSIATALLRSPLNCCDRSNRLWGKHLLREEESNF